MPPDARRRRRWLAALALLAVGCVFALPPALSYQRTMANRTECQSNLRRLSLALLAYAQDYDGSLPPPGSKASARTWLDDAAPYVREQEVGACPDNPPGKARSVETGSPFPCSYALNERFFGVFAPGPFPVENVEIPAQTALLVEGGRMRESSPFGPPYGELARATFTDTSLDPLAFPSPHAGRMCCAAADGHVVHFVVAHYRPGGHDTRYGRLGGMIFDWNGGHPNGDTATPPRE